MKKKTSIISVALAAAMTASLAGCGDQSTTATTAGSQSATTAAAGETAQADSGSGDSIVTAQTDLTFIFADGDEGAKKAMAPLVVGGQDLWHMGFLFNKAYDDQVMSVDPDFIEHCYDGSRDFSDPAIKAAFAEMQEIMSFAQDGWVSTPDAQITTFLVNDMAAMMYSGTHMFSQILQADPEFELGWFPIPSPDGKIRLVGGSGVGGLAISAEAAADPDKKAAAEEFIRFFFAPENYKVYCENLNSIPSTVETPDLDVLPVLEEVIEATATADTLTPMWNGKSGSNELPPDFRNFTYKTLIEVLQGTRDIDSACEEMNKTWQVAAESFNPVTGAGME